LAGIKKRKEKDELIQLQRKLTNDHKTGHGRPFGRTRRHLTFKAPAKSTNKGVDIAGI
jgi:hypothetical protein